MRVEEKQTTVDRETGSQTIGRSFEKVCEILDHHQRNPAMLIPILQAVQAEYRYLPKEALAYVATSLGLPPARVFGVATFYAHFALSPKGKYVIHVCDGTACHVKNSQGLVDAIRKRLGLSEDKHTTDDMLFTVETVSCVGACGLAPVAVINEAVHRQVSPQAGVAAIEKILESEEQA
ncbi:MAG: NAD(P)H-dependent oxidoreductase subunit E [Spirochaetaceae bacterium]|nr:MAG: NAD(P)H-dependent oxidoreductase subunit E [Spirochaetaceae bacterium]